MLKEFIAQKEWICPPEPSVRIVVDMIEFCARARAALAPGVDQRLPHPRGRLDGGAGAGVHARRRHRLRRGGVERGLAVDDFAPRLSFFFNLHNDFLEEIAKLRAARRLWATDHARALRRQEPALAAAPHARADGGRARSPRSSRSTTSCASPCRRSPACSAACSRCTPTRWTRRWRCPTEQAVMVALRTQQIIAEESGVTNIVDPLGGS